MLKRSRKNPRHPPKALKLNTQGAFGPLFVEGEIVKLILLLTLLLSGCNSLKYESDIGFLNSAQANSMEYYAKINGTPCRDMDGIVGLCTKRLASNQELKIEMDARDYAYRFNLQCTSTLGVDFSQDVLAGKAFSFAISPEKFRDVRSFTCIGEVFPQDRDQEVSANWSVRVVVYDSQYQPREIVYVYENHLIFGKHARYITADGKRYSKKTSLKGADQIRFAYSESERMRFNYWWAK